MRKLAFYTILLTISLLLLSTTKSAQAQFGACSIDLSEPHPLRPYPGEICGPEAERTIDETDEPYCAMRPWAAKTVVYLKNQQDCPSSHPTFPCVIETIAGIFNIDLSEYELPLVSVTRPGFDDLTFFNRAQQHLADYLEGRAYYDAYLEAEASSVTDFISVWKRLGVLRKLLSLFPKNSGESVQNALKIRMINNAGISHHNYIVGYVRSGNLSEWGSGRAIRLSDFKANPTRRFPPEYTCSSISDPTIRQECHADYRRDVYRFNNRIYGKLWPYVPMFTREDAKGFVNVIPEPGQPFGYQSATVSIPHLPRLNAVSTMLRKMLSSQLLEAKVGPEDESDMGIFCPAGPWFMSGAACYGGLGGCGDIEVDCNQSSTATDSCVKSKTTIRNLALSWVSGTPGNHVDECYNDVIARAKSAGVNPAFSMLIWLNESNASNYNISRQDFGINNPALECSFRRQINSHLAKPDAYKSGWSHCFGASAPVNPGTGVKMTPMEAFLWIYRTGDCNPSNSDGQDYAAGIINRWSWVSTCPMPSYPKYQLKTNK
jgi:hypothetical protein